MSLTGREGGGGDGRREAAAAEEEGPALELLDEYWFFSNTLVKNGRQSVGRPPMLPRSPLTPGGRPRKGQSGARKEGLVAEPAGMSRFYALSGGRRLLRTPSLPSPRVGMELSIDEEVVEETAAAAAAGGGCHEADAEDDDLNWSSIYEGVLRSRIAEGGGGRSMLQRAPSMPVTSSATGRDDNGRGEETAAFAFTKSTPRMSKLRHAHSTLEKWKSSSDLESIEVQGFRDLGFVFDQEELRESLADVLPGLRGKAKTPSGSGSASDNDDATATTTGGDSTVRRPYLSEAWHHARRPAAPPPATAAAIRLQQADATSAAEMKDQIRMWAQAVACNVRQEC